MRWYFQVNDYCLLLSELYNIPLIKVAGILSALSPNNTFRGNVKSLEKFLKYKTDCKVSTFNGQKEKAKQIYFIDNPTEDKIKNILNGEKTKAFFENIYRPYSSTAVTIDLWMLRIFKINGSLTKKKYKELETKIQQQAESYGVRPHELQAKLWVDVRKAAF